MGFFLERGSTVTGTIRFPVMLIVAALIGTATASPAHAAFPGANGKIVFSSNRDGNDEIYVMNADGSARIDLSRNPASDTQPEWSPSGTQIAFASDRSGEYEVYVMNADGSGVTQLTTGGPNTRPVFTADGKYIVFTSTRDGNSEIYRMELDGSDQTNLTNDPGDDRLPAAAPKGDRILFQSSRTGFARLYIMSDEGGVAREVPGGPLQELDGNWAPRGNGLTFLGNNGGFSEFDVYTARVNGSDVTNLTNTPGRVEFDPIWSPSGRQIVFEGCTDLGTDTQHCALYTMYDDGTGQTDISTPRIPYLDTFSGDRIDPFWTPPFITGSGVSMTETNGQIEVPVPSTAMVDPSLGFISLSMNAQCQLAGDFDIQVDYRLLSWPSPSGVNIGFGTFPPDFSSVHGMFVFDPGGGTGVSTGFPGPVNTFLPTPGVLSGTLRLTRTDATITAYWRGPDGWNTLQTTSDSTAPTLFGLNVFSNIAHADVKVAYDNFRVNSGTFACPFWWTDNAHDWQPVPWRQ